MLKKKTCRNCGLVFFTKRKIQFCSLHCANSRGITPKRVLRKRYNLKWPEKRNARSSARYAVKIGKLIPRPCEKCGSMENIEKHHKDYSKPLEVKWLCKRCHWELACF